MTSFREKALLVALSSVLLASWPAYATWSTQEITLNPGWNAVFVELQPENNRTESVFSGVPVKSVWAWNERFSSVQYVRDPNTLVPEQPEWLTFYPASSPNGFLTNLFAIQGGKAYLVEMDGDQPVTITLEGQLMLREPVWLSNSFNLVGFHLDSQNATTFADYFAPSSAHAGKDMYTLNAVGEWVKIVNPASEPMRRGAAYWVYCEGQSSYGGPLGVDLQIGRGLDYGHIVEEQMLKLTNSTDQPKTVTFTIRPSTRPADRPSTGADSGDVPPLAGDVKLGFRRIFSWEPLEEPLEVTVDPNSTLGVEFAVLRAKMNVPPSQDAVFESVLDVSDGEGQLFRIPVSAQKNITMAGLWVGTVTVNAVSEAAGSLATTTPTASEFRFRIIVHVDNQATPRLLQQVFLMQVQPDPQDPITYPARYVLVTDEDLVDNFTGVSMRDGEIVGRRISSSVFAFKDPIDLSGSLTGTLLGTVPMAFGDRHNPFIHAFHPDHDNLNDDFDLTPLLPEGRESFTFSREITLEFLPDDPFASALPGYGHTIVGGNYREKISGVHQKALYVSGSFQLNHVVDVPTLNDAP